MLTVAVLFALSLFSSSCDNELNQIAEMKDIPVVYGLINRNDTAHFLRVEKVFVDSEITPAELAQDPANLYYDNIQVQLKNVTTNEVFNLDRVDGTNEGYPRDGGPFVSSPNYLYKLKLPDGQTFGNGDQLEVSVIRGDNEEPVTAKTKIVSDFSVVSPKIDLVNTLRMVSQNNIICKFDRTNAFIFDFYYILHYQEKNVNEAQWTSKSLLWKVGSDVIPQSNKDNASVSIPADGFITFVAANIDPEPGIIRQFVGLDIRIDAGGADLRNSVELSKVNGGLTSSQVAPTYSNVTNGLGLVSSRNSILLEGFVLHVESRDSLRKSPLTADLQFQ